MSRWLASRYPLDRFVAAVLALVTAPFVAALALVIRRADAGPGLVALERIGQGGRPFRLWKLRTMRAAASGGRAGGPAITRGDDERVTPIGSRLRRWRIDELPQLWNVVRGEMALIGPRPETPEYVDLTDDRWTAVLRARPGIAGFTQALVHRWEPYVIDTDADCDAYGRVVLPVKLELDAWYVAHASARLDMEIALSLFAQFTMARAPSRLLRIAERAGVESGRLMTPA